MPLSLDDVPSVEGREEKASMVERERVFLSQTLWPGPTDEQ